MSFVHLHVHSQYSLLEASCRTKSLAKKAKEFGMPALAITDNGNMFGAIEFYFACKSEGIKPIIGLDVYLAPYGRLVKGENKNSGRKPNTRLVLLAKDYEGYQSLCEISSIGYQEGFYYKPRVDYEVLKKYNKGLICLSGGLRGEVAFSFLENGEEEALKKIEELKNIYLDNIYLELNRSGLPQWNEVNDFLIQASKKTDVPLVAANDVYYLEKEDAFSVEVLRCIASNRTLLDENRPQNPSEEFYFKSSDQMELLFHDCPEALESTIKIAEKCNLEFKFKDESGKPIYHLPTYPTQGGRSLSEEIRSIAFEGLNERFEESKSRGEVVEKEKIEVYHKRLDYELGVINKMGFEGYFLIVQDFIQWAKKNNVPVGPGRGSGAGSLVAFCLKITDLDPIPYNLIFERFLNPERISMPDFDIDFCQDRRGEVINYVIEKYTKACVSQIITFGKLQTRAAIRDVGRVLGMTFSEVDVIAKLVPDKLGITLSESLEMESRFEELMEEDPKVAKLIDLAQKVEGLTRHASIHAAGVIISDKPLVEHAPLYKAEQGENVVQYDMKNSEKIGLIKFDFLGLKTLTHINEALRLVKINRSKEFSTKDISLSDTGIYEIMSRGDTAGIFQFEGDGISDLIRKVQPSCFEDITAINALYRPGPMQMLDEYVGRKHGKIKVSYLFPELEEILKETYGIIVYQEQVQLIAARIANYSLGEADVLRRAMGKKIAEEMEKQKERFLSGAKENNHDPKKAEELFDLMAKFAQYGFNKSHAAAYCVVAAQTAWLKNYYPVEFFAALLSTEMSDTDKVVKYVKDARNHNIEVRAPSVNFSERKFTVKGDCIFFGLGAIKGVGTSAVEEILETRTREGGKYRDIYHFFECIDLRRVNKKVIECLVKSGALDELGGRRSQIMQAYPMLVGESERRKEDKEIGQGSLFSFGDEEAERVHLPEVEEWTKRERLIYEKEVLGFYLSDHPLSGIENLISAFSNGKIEDLNEFEPKKKVVIGGLISIQRELITKKGTRMAFASLEDLTGSVELIVFPDSFAKLEGTIKTDEPVLVYGTLEREETTSKIIVEDVEHLEKKLKNSQRVLFRLEPQMREKLPSLKEILKKYPGETEIGFRIEMPEEGRSIFLDSEDPDKVSLEHEMIDRVGRCLGKYNFLELASH